MFKFSGSSYLTSALSYRERHAVSVSRLGGFTYLDASRRKAAPFALGAILDATPSVHMFVCLENESEAGMLGLQEFEQQFAFKDLMIHLILQFTLHIAFRGVLHRCGNQEIHR